MHDRDKAFSHFRRVDPKLHKAILPHRTTLPPKLLGKPTRAALFESLIETIVSQQLSVKAADTIFARVKKACGGKITPESLKKARLPALRAAGLSGAKQKALKAIAEAVGPKGIDLLSLKKLSPEEARAKLVTIWGVGPWSAEMFLMFALAHPDIFSIGDLGLVRAMETIYGLPKDTDRKKLLGLSTVWAPHRTYAAMALWKSRDAKPK